MVTVVPEQELPDGRFPNSILSKPRGIRRHLHLHLHLAKKVDADLVLATDPDADRLGVYAKDTKTGEYQGIYRKYVWHVNLRVRDVTEEGTWHSAG